MSTPEVCKHCGSPTAAEDRVCLGCRHTLNEGRGEALKEFAAEVRGIVGPWLKATGLLEEET
jgi:hypothetical protein